MPCIDLGEALAWPARNMSRGLAGRLLVDRAHGLGGAAALVLGVSRTRSYCSAIARMPSALDSDDDAGDLAGAAGGGFQRLVEQAGEALEPLLDVLGADVERGDQRARCWSRRSPTDCLGCAVAAVDQRDGLAELAAVRVELRRRAGRDRRPRAR